MFKKYFIPCWLDNSCCPSSAVSHQSLLRTSNESCSTQYWWLRLRLLCSISLVSCGRRDPTPSAMQPRENSHRHPFANWLGSPPNLFKQSTMSCYLNIVYPWGRTLANPSVFFPTHLLLTLCTALSFLNQMSWWERTTFSRDGPV